MLRILEELSYAGLGGGLILAFGKQSTLTVEAIGLREDSRSLSKLEPGRYMITVWGYDYYQKLKAPRAYWLRRNWFPVAVLLVSSLVTVLSSLLVKFLD